jgi:hypothetical protein
VKALSDECGKDRISTMLNDLMSINAGQMSALANAIEDAVTPAAAVVRQRDSGITCRVCNH